MAGKIYNTNRPVGDAGRGRHTGKVGWLGGKHRDNSGGICGILTLAMLGVGVSILGGIGYGAYSLIA